MIKYDEGQGLCRTVFGIRGSVIPGAMMWALPASLFTFLLVLADSLLPEYEMRSFFGMTDVEASSGQIYTATTAGIILLIAFRTRQALTRFWEGTSLLHQMRGEWFDSVSCLMAFSVTAMDTKPVEVRDVYI